MKRLLAIGLVLLAENAFAQGYTLVTTTDFSTGSTSSVDRDAHTSDNNVQAIHSDAVARAGDGVVYILNRAGGNNIQILDPYDDFDTIHQFSTGANSNPHDIIVRSGNVAYITRYDMTTVLKMDLTNGATLATINLAAFADADGIPEMDQMYAQNQTLYVLLQRLDRNNFYSPTATSYVVAIDMLTNAVIDLDLVTPGVQAMPLIRTNPYSEIVSASAVQTGKLAFSCAGSFGVNDGGIVMISPASPNVQSMMLTETAAGGDILDFEILNATRAYAIVANASFQTVLIEFNPTTGTKTGATIYNPGGYDLSDLEIGAQLMVADRKATNPGVRFFDTATNTANPAGPLDVGLPPFDILDVIIYCPTGDCETAVGDTPAVASLGANYPNPFNPDTSIPFSLARAGDVTLRVYDVDGALVATLLDAHRAAGSHVVRWNGRTDDGRVAPTGVYFARLDANGASETRKMVLLK